MSNRLFTVAVVGSRELPQVSYPVVYSVVKQAVEHGHEVVSGGAIGADFYALRALLELGGLACSLSRIFLPGTRQMLMPLYRDTMSLYEQLGGTIVSGSARPGMEFKDSTRAIFRRSVMLVKASNTVVGFIHGESTGTWFALEAAKRLGKGVVVFARGFNDLHSLGCGDWGHEGFRFGQWYWYDSVPKGEICRHGISVQHCQGFGQSTLPGFAPGRL